MNVPTQPLTQAQEPAFSNMGLIAPILNALNEEGYTIPTPIQAQSITPLLQGRDLLGCAQTGTGKTAAFALPILQRLYEQGKPASPQRAIRALILTPTRELAIQIEESLRAYGRHLPLRHLVIFGGVGQQAQVDGLRRGVDVLVATPGRLLDLMSQGFIHLQQLQIFVLDEADRMLDMGFVHDVRKVMAKLPPKRQNLLFSATMPADIQDIANNLLTNPVKVEVTPVSSTAETVQQQLYYVSKNDKRHLLLHLLQSRPEIDRLLVFTRTKHGADRVVKDLVKAGQTALAIHGNKSQNARQAALKSFKEARTRVLVATDIAARGIDIDELGFVVNYDIPNIPETYVHRIGRTGRAGASGMAFSFCEAEERPYLRDIQKLIGKTVPVVEEHPFVEAAGAKPTHQTQEKQIVKHLQHAGHDRRNQPQRRPERKDNQRQQPNKPQQSNRPQQPKPLEVRPEGNNRPAQPEAPRQPQPQRQGQSHGNRSNPPRRTNKTLAPLPPPRPKQYTEESNTTPNSNSGGISFTPLFNDDDKW